MTDLQIQKIAEDMLTKEALLEKLLPAVKNLFKSKAVRGLTGGIAREPSIARGTSSTISPTGKLDKFISDWHGSKTNVPLTATQQAEAPKNRAWFSRSAKAPTHAIVEEGPAAYTPFKGIANIVDPRVGVGEVAGNIGKLRDAINNKGILKGLGQFAGDQLRDSQYYTKNGLKYERSPIGKIINPLWSSGAGMGAIGAATAEGKDGAPPTLGKRLRSGISQGALWGVAPHATGMYYMGRGALDLFSK